MKHWVIFDFDGTIANSIIKLFGLINGLAPKYGYTPITSEKFAQMRDLPLAKACRILKIPLYKVSSLAPLILREYESLIPDLEPYPEIVDMLKQLEALDVSLALVSSNHKENVQAFLKHWDINCFSWVEGTSGILHKHASIRQQIKKHGLNRDHVLYIGDEVRDIKAARKSGIQVISVTWGLHSRENLARSNPDFLVDTPTHIVDIVQRMLNPVLTTGSL
jgi:phosphoglycolate phosphatase